MRLVLVLGPSSGGIGRHVRQLADAFAAEGWDVTVAGPSALAHGDGWFADFAAANGRFVAVPVPGPWTSSVRALSALAPLVRSADVVHAHGLRAGLTGALAARRAGVPSVVTVHNLVSSETAGGTWRLTRGVERLVVRVATIAVGASPDITDRLGAAAVTVPVAAPPLRATRSRAEVRAELGVADGEVLVVCAARLHPQKRLADLVDAAAEPAVVDGGVTVRIAGDGPQHDELAARIRNSGSSTVLLGRRDDIADLYAAADVAALTSAWEAIPLALQEAASFGLPLVGTATGGIPLVVEDGVTGTLVPVGDVEAIARALRHLADDPAARAELGAGARAHVEERFGAERMLVTLEGLYRDAIRSSTSRPRPGGAG